MTDGESLLFELRSEAQSGASVLQPEPETRRPTSNPREIVTGDAEWPRLLNEVTAFTPPDRLFVEGRAFDNDKPAVGIVGTRRPTAAGVEAAEQFTKGLVEAGFTIVSGMAVGIDAVAHRTALRAGGTTIAVLGCGLDVDYPLRNHALKKQVRESGAILTEYPEGTPPHAQHFPSRNRIVAGMCTGVLVVEGGPKSGALITASRALEANRSVWAIPGSIRNAMAEGPNELIRSLQASLVTKVDHICGDLAPQLVWDPEGAHSPLSVESLSPEERKVLSVLDDVAVPPDRVIRLTRLAPGEVALALSSLEVRGYVLRRRSGYEITGSGGRIRNVLLDEADSDA